MSERRGTKALELWCRRLLAGYDGVTVENMTTSWRNGLAFCALIHRFRPDLIDFSSLKADDIYHNNELAFRTAETHLGIPALLDPEDMVDNEVPDRLSILTYLSQFYQRLGYTVTKNDNNNEASAPPSPLSPQSPLSPSVAASLKLSKGGYEICASCGMPVYLAQRLMVSRKLYHRSCLRCSSCKTQLSPHACYENSAGTEFCCEACKNAQDMPPLNEDDDRMGMVMFRDDETLGKPASPVVAIKEKRQTISDKIKLFESSDVINKKLPEIKHNRWRYTDEIDGKIIALADNEKLEKQDSDKCTKTEVSEKILESTDISTELVDTNKLTNSTYKSNVNKLSFLQTQLSTDNVLQSVDVASVPEAVEMFEKFPDIDNKVSSDIVDSTVDTSCLESDESKINTNVPDDVRLEEKFTQSCKINESAEDEKELKEDKQLSCVEEAVDVPVVIPPRRRNGAQKKISKETPITLKESIKPESVKLTNEYPEDLNPFSDDEIEETVPKTSTPKTVSTNPFGSSDEEEELAIQVTPVKIAPPRVNVIPALNPFWSDGEEPTSDEDESRGSSLNTPRMCDKSIMTCSTPNLQSVKKRRIKPRAPRPPVLTLHEAPNIEIDTSYSMDDGASLSSLSSHCSNIYSENKTGARLTPKLRKKRPAPTPPDGASLVSAGSGRGRPASLIPANRLSADEPDSYKFSDESGAGTWRRVKGPAPGLPLPGRRVVRPQLSPGELQTQLDLLETQQLGLERQGVLLEQMIRDRCEGENVQPAPAEEVEDLVIQLCELVNEKNDLFRKQAELMYIRRQQRLEQEQADIEHEIRIIQARPAVNRIDADKAREEQLVARLVDMVRLRDELVQQLEYERRRERAEDEAISLCIAQRRATRGSDSNHSSLQSDDVVRTPKKSNKVKDKVKKQIKKAKNTLNIKKKDSSSSSKDNSAEKKEKSK